MSEFKINSIKVNTSNEYGSIGEKVAKKWLKENGYEVYPFNKIWWLLQECKSLRGRIKRARKLENKERLQEILHINEQSLSSLFGSKIVDVVQYYFAVLKVLKESGDVGSSSLLRQRGIFPDFIIKKDKEIAFIEVKANQAHLTKYQIVTLKLAKEYGFKTMIFRLDIIINVLNNLQLTEL